MKNRWLILALICLINLCAGSIYSWSVLSAAAAERLTVLTGMPVSAGELALAFAIANGIGPVPMILGGALNDRFGPKVTIVSGGVLIGAGLACCGLLSSVSAITLCYGLFFGIGLALTYGTCISTAVRLFPERRGLAGGIVTTAYGMSSVILPPVAQWLIGSTGIENTFIVLGAVFGGVIVAGGLLTPRPAPALSTAGAPVEDSSKRPAEMLRSVTFWPMLGLLLCGAFPAMMIISQASSVARAVLACSPAQAATLVSVLAFSNMLSRLISGGLSDRFGRLPVLAAALTFAAAGLFLMTLAAPDARLYFVAGIIGVGISFGAFMGIYPGFTADRFGTRYASVNYGVMFTGFALAGILAPVTMHRLQSAGWSFAQCAWLAIGLCVLGLLLTAVCRVTTQRGKHNFCNRED